MTDPAAPTITPRTAPLVAPNPGERLPAVNAVAAQPTPRPDPLGLRRDSRKDLIVLGVLFAVFSVLAVALWRTETAEPARRPAPVVAVAQRHVVSSECAGPDWYRHSVLVWSDRTTTSQGYRSC